MKKLLIIALYIFTSINVFAYENIPYMFYKLIPYGASPDEVNDILIKSNFIESKVIPISGTFYITTYYPDPDLVWYNSQTFRWYNIKFTTNDISKIFEIDNKISFFSYKTDEEFKCMIVTSDNFSKDISSIGTNSKWIYKFFFHNDELFAVSSQYQDPSVIAPYKEKNPNNQYAHPGFIIPKALFNKIIEGFKTKYGKYHNSTIITLDKYTDMFYGNYRNKKTGTSLSIYYAEYFLRNINFVASYIDDIRLKPISERFQKFLYKRYQEIVDLPIDIMDVIE